MDEAASPEPESLNTSEFSDWSSFSGEWWCLQPPVPWHPSCADLTALSCPPTAGGVPEQEVAASAAAAPAFYGSQAPRSSASPQPEQHTVIHINSPEPLTHGELGPGRGVVSAEEARPHPEGPFLTSSKDAISPLLRRPAGLGRPVPLTPMPEPLPECRRLGFHSLSPQESVRHTGRGPDHGPPRRL